MKLEDLFCKNNFFCILPWIHIYGSVEGVWGRCCMDNSTHYDLEYKNSVPSDILLHHNSLGCIDSSNYSNSNPYEVRNLSQVFNSPQLMKTRITMLDEKQVAPCQSCYEIDNNGGISYRRRMNDLFKNWDSINWSDLINATGIHGYIDVPSLYIDIRFGNYCNFKCIMCNFPTSSKWVTSESNHLKDSYIIDPYFNNSIFWIDLGRMVRNVSRIYFAGGEPFLQKGHLKLINMLISKRLAIHIHLVYSTNLSFFSNKQIRLLEKFKTVELGVLCDGTESIFEYIRKVSNWKTFTANLTLAKTHFKIILLFTTQLSNVFYIVPFINWAHNEGLSIDFSNILLYPKNLSIRNLSRNENLYVLTQLSAYKDYLLKIDANDYAFQLQIVIDFLNSQKQNYARKE